MTLDQIKESIAAWAARRKWEAEWQKANAGRLFTAADAKRAYPSQGYCAPSRNQIVY